jgi:hypothetical protein
MKKITCLLLAGFIMPFFLFAQEVFENEYFKITLPEDLKPTELPAEIIEGRDNTFWFRSGHNAFNIKKMESKLTASDVILEFEKANKKMGNLVQSQRFNVNGYVLPGLVLVDQPGATKLGHIYIAFDNGRHKLAEAGNAYVFTLEMVYSIEDEAKRQPINEKALQSLMFKHETIDFFKTKDFSITAPALSFVYYGSSAPRMMLPSNPLVEISFGEIKEGAYGTSPNPAFADVIKKEVKAFKQLHSKVTVTEMTIGGYKAALLIGKYENKEYKSCSWKYQYLIEVSANLVRTLNYELLCDYSEVQQPKIDEIVKTFKENKK